MPNTIDQVRKRLLRPYKRARGHCTCDAEYYRDRARQAIRNGRGMGISPLLLLVMLDAIMGTNNE